MNSIANLSPKQLRQAADLKERIDALQAQLNELVGTPTEAEVETKARGKGKFSPAAIARIRAAQKARWARVKGAAQPETAAPEQKPKRKFTTAGRKALSLAAKARWAKAKAQGKSKL